MASLIPTRSTLHEEVEEEFRRFHHDLIACEICGDYHVTGVHDADFTPFEPDEPEGA